MTTPLVVGAGAVGLHAARHLAVTPGVERVLVADADPRRSAAVTEEAGEQVEAVDWCPGRPFPTGASLVVSAVPEGVEHLVVEQAIEAGLPAVACGDGVDAVRRLLDLDSAAASSGVAVVAGAGLAPGLSEVLAAHAAEALDHVTEVHVARFGTTGPACRRAARRGAWGRSVELAGGAWARPRAGSSRRLVYFPEPVGPHDCRRAANGALLLLPRAFPGVDQVTVRYAMGVLNRAGIPHRRRAPEALGALHVEVRGRRNRGSEILTYGAVDRMAAATGAVLATTAAVVAGLVPGLGPPPPGVAGLGETGPPRAVLAELARRGVRGARFGGVS